VLTKTTNGLATWAAPSAAGTTFVSDNSMIVSTLSGVYTVTSTISTAAAFLGSAIVASNASTVASVVSATPGGAGYVLTKGLTGLPAWAAASGGGGGGSGTTPIMVNIVYSNTQATPTLWNDTGTANSILLDSNIMVASNAAN
jgi:hypothetical protein